MRGKQYILTIIFLSGYLLAHAQQSDKIMQKGNEYYKRQQYSEALKEFSKINEGDSLSEEARYNQANTLYKLGKKDESIKMFKQLSGIVKDTLFLSKLSYNEAVVLGSEGNLEESISAYEQALLFNPQDEQARDNLQKALLELKKKSSPPEKKKQQQQPKMNPRDAANKLKQLEQKEKQVQQRVQKEKSVDSVSKPKDW
ncbi:MAG: hypothetical protein B6D37_02690 [Sphingobacteriales bacterium UTBCD1]|jgi:tetratricopeptide (TPR) repeat protein|nr:MAG: hypothetical protein B6D37_02690 [Sphingobacteriales bacterium UTBCD1]